MSHYDGAQLLIFIIALLCLIPLLGNYMRAIFIGNRIWVHSILEWLEKAFYKICGINSQQEMGWVAYTQAILTFNFFGFLTVFLLQIFQHTLPLNPQNLSAVPLDLAFNTAISFTTNTNWQSYAGETTLSYLVQMVGLTVQNFLSAATGLAVLLALTRGIIRKNADTIGNFWVDLVRSVVYLFLPLSILMALVLVGEGVIQNFSSYTEVTTLENASQIIPQGPVASQVAIKQLGTNGGGFFNANSAHPFENPTPFSNFLEMMALLLIPAASVYMYGLFVGSRNHGYLLLFVMAIFWITGLGVSLSSESLYNPVVGVFPNLEGKETRFGILGSQLWSVSTTASANGSINAMMSSMTPLAGGIALFNIMLGELIFGGVGVGLCSMIMYVLLTMFLSGLMVGRTPEYLGKKIEKKEIQWVIVAILTPGALILIGAGISSVLPVALSSVSNPGPHGLSEILYAFSSAAGNNGSAFAGLNANTPYYNLALGIVMLLGRMAIVIPSLAIAGLLVQKKFCPPSSGTFDTDNYLFVILLMGVIFIIGALTFFPALSLGPIVEHILMLQGRAF